MKTIKFVLVTLCCFLAVNILTALTFIYLKQEKMIFQPVRLQKGHQFSFTQPYEEIRIPVEGGLIDGILFTTPHPKGLIFYLHGNSGSVDTWGSISDIYTALGYDIFIMDYRTYGLSEGTIESEQQFHGDIAEAYKTITKRYDQKNTIIIGYSIGTGPAAYLASRNNPKMLVLQAPYYSLIEMADNRLPGTPDFLKKYQFRTYEFLPKVKCPVCIFHGDQDNVIPYDSSVRLSKENPRAKFYTLKGHGHLKLNQNSDFQSAIATILK